MRLSPRSLLASALLSCVVAAQAEVLVGTMEYGYRYDMNGSLGPYYDIGTPYDPYTMFYGPKTVSIDGSIGTFSFAKRFLNVLNTAGIEAMQVEPALLDPYRSAQGRYLAITSQAPLSALGVRYDTDSRQLNVNQVRMAGGLEFRVAANGLTSSGGALSLNNITVDVPSQTIFADIVGGNGVGSRELFPVWQFSSLTGSKDFLLPADLRVDTTSAVTGMALTPEANQLFAQSFGLIGEGLTALDAVPDYGMVSLNIRLNTWCSGSCATGKPFVPEVPEPASSALMSLGLLGVALAALRRA